MTNCINCGHALYGKYCSNCGQRAEQKRYTMDTVLHEVVHFFTHFEKGFLHTIWGFIARPGVTSVNLVKGKRKSYQPPVSFFLICTGLYILVHNFIINQRGYHIAGSDTVTLSLKEQANVFLRAHFSPIILFILIVSAFIIYLVLARPKFNFTEVFILSFYGGGTYLAMLLVSDMILGLLFGINILSVDVFLWQTLLSSVYNFWFCYNLFSELHIRNLWPRLIITALLIAGIGYILFVYLPLAWLQLFH